MVLFNYSTKELTAKIVFYGPGLCGKTTNLQYIHGNLPETVKGKMLSLATKTDRTLFFDFLPIDLGEIRGMKTRIQLYTVPGQVFYNETRKLVLKGADGIVFVADSQQPMLGANVESFNNLEENLKGHGLTLAEMPHVIQFNKRDLPKLSTIEELNSAINRFNAPFYESVATTGIGVQDTLKAITKLVLLHLTRKYDPKTATAAKAAPAVAPVVAPAAPSSAPAVAGSMSAVPLSADPAPIPVASAMASAATPASMPSAPSADGVPAFDEDEIDGLVDEVEEIGGDGSAETMTVEAEIPLATESVADSLIETPAAAPAPEAASTEDMAASLGLKDGDSSAPAADFEVDHGVDPDWDRAPSGNGESASKTVSVQPNSLLDDAPLKIEEIDEIEEIEDFETTDSTPSASGNMDAAVTLTEALDDAELFEDPNLEVARLSAGEAREIVIPVEVGDPGTAPRRFKLTLRLKLDLAK